VLRSATALPSRVVNVAARELGHRFKTLTAKMPPLDQFDPADPNMFSDNGGVRGFNPPRYRSPNPHELPGDQKVELARVELATADRTPKDLKNAQQLAAIGLLKVWLSEAKDYRSKVGFFKGWTATLLLLGTLGVTGLINSVKKYWYHEKRPFDAPGNHVALPPGKKPFGPSFPSGHSALSEAGAIYWSRLDTAEAARLKQTAKNVQISRPIYGAHYFGDVAAGARLGAYTGNWMPKFLVRWLQVKPA
jgi:hypothetical protein